MSDQHSRQNGRLHPFERLRQAHPRLVDTQYVDTHGFVRLVDLMGDDTAIVQMARVSYGEGTKTVRTDEGLIRYLMRNHHTSPFESCEIKLHVKLPIFVARQLIRHRTASVNEISARYSVLPEEFFVPDIDNVHAQEGDTKQMRGGELPLDTRAEFVDSVRGTGAEAFALYHEQLQQGVARELARVNLPLGTYTEMYWKIDLHNLLHFLQLRLSPHAQPEIRVYAEAIARIVQAWVPATWFAFEDYRLNATTFSAREMLLLRTTLGRLPGAHDLLREYATEERAAQETQTSETRPLSKREIQAFLKALGVLGAKVVLLAALALGVGPTDGYANDNVKGTSKKATVAEANAEQPRPRPTPIYGVARAYSATKDAATKDTTQKRDA